MDRIVINSILSTVYNNLVYIQLYIKYMSPKYINTISYYIIVSIIVITFIVMLEHNNTAINNLILK